MRLSHSTYANDEDIEKQEIRALKDIVNSLFMFIFSQIFIKTVETNLFNIVK